MKIAIDIGIKLVLYKDRVETARWGVFFISFRRSGLYFLDKSRGLLIFLARTWMLLHHAISTWRYSFFNLKKHLLNY